MIFNPKHAHINNLFAELGCTIGKLRDSSKYDARFIDIADRVITLNEGGKVDRKVLSVDIDLMLSMLEKEGYWKQVIILKEKNIKKVIKYPRWFRWIKAMWYNAELGDGKPPLCTLAIGLFMIIPTLIGLFLNIYPLAVIGFISSIFPTLIGGFMTGTILYDDRVHIRKVIQFYDK